MKALSKKVSAYTALSKIRLYAIAKFIRNLPSYLDPVGESRNFIERAKAASQGRKPIENMPLTADQRILIPASRRDGVGIQSMARICVMFLAQQAKATYVHLPFLQLGHQSVDLTGRSLTSAEWAAQWEAFLNLGKDEYHIADLENAMGAAELAKALSAQAQLGPSGMKGSDQLKLPQVVESIRKGDPGSAGIYRFDLKLFQQHRKCQLFLDAEFVRSLQEKFAANNYVPEKNLYSEKYLNIAIHIRRGDVWDAYSAGSKDNMIRSRFASEEYYVELIKRLQNFFGLSSKPVRFHIFSDGVSDNFSKFTFTGEHEASLQWESGLRIENIQFHLRQNTFDTLYHMINAPIFVPGKSTFSLLAVILGSSCVLYDNEIFEDNNYRLLEEYMEGNPRFTLLDGLEGRVAAKVCPSAIEGPENY